MQHLLFYENKFKSQLSAETMQLSHLQHDCLKVDYIIQKYFHCAYSTKNTSKRDKA